MWVLLGSLFAFAGDAPPSDGAALLAAYEAVRVRLVEDRLADAREAARKLATSEDVPADVVAAATRVADASDATTRTAFGELSRALVVRLDATTLPDGVRVFHCPMWPTYAYWLQASSGIANPYMGTSMPTCGEGTSFKAAVRAATP